MNDIKYIHLIGIKGVGMAALAILLSEAGVSVTGSDTNEQFITDKSLSKAGIMIYNNFSPVHINKAQLVIYTGAHGGRDNPEVKAASEKGIKALSYAEAVGLLMEGGLLKRKQKGISVAGTHGKTTTTAIITTIFAYNKLDPSFIIGTSEIPSLSNCGHYGSGEYFIVEADEYATEPKYDKRPKFIWHKPKIAVITNIEHDHPDIFPSLESVVKVFSDFLNSLPNGSKAILNGDDQQIIKTLSLIKVKKITYGFNSVNDVVISDAQSVKGSMYFNLKRNGKNLGEFEIKIPGIHNVYNSTAAIVTSFEAGLEIDQIRKGLEQFSGSKRRLEFKGTLENGALFYDDYAHHPTEIRRTLDALVEMYAKKKILCIFQPHTFSRTKTLFHEFARSFSSAEQVIITDIFVSAREIPDESVSSENLADEARKYHKNVLFSPNIQDVVKYLIDTKPGSDTVVVTMGAGNIYKISEILQLKNP